MRFIGVTGHGTRIAGMHLRSLERFDFDSVLLPYNHSMLRNAAYRADVRAAASSVCVERDVAVQTIKSVARRRWPRRRPGRTTRWYEPLTEPATPSTAPCASCSATPTLFLNSSSDARLLPPVLDAAERGLDAPDRRRDGRRRRPRSR